MFSILSAYLYQEKKISIPGIGRFELAPKNAAAGFDAVEAPAWEIRFTEDKAATASENPDSFYTLLAAKEAISNEEARQQFEEFARNTQVKLNDQETVVWEDVGILEKPDFRVVFTPQTVTLSPFSGITAQRVIREHASHQVLRGENETSSEAIREEMLAAGEKRSTGLKIAWIVLAATAVIAALFFLKNGCSLQSAANQQKATIQKPADTYELK
ncbi:hypothetical protein [Niabella beijingensis]|uniref:hypothetical protein n=1 Tax=Niabella beijingensis TaxID=2872700 RepID=UPI001CBF2E39|nr:hypothetical protein [Niabella beijingensis]MBZ4188323.1 hypothetical protein [Niabella beijingensis]